MIGTTACANTNSAASSDGSAPFPTGLGLRSRPPVQELESRQIARMLAVWSTRLCAFCARCAQLSSYANRVWLRRACIRLLLAPEYGVRDSAATTTMNRAQLPAVTGGVRAATFRYAVVPR